MRLPRRNEMREKAMREVILAQLGRFVRMQASSRSHARMSPSEIT